MYDQNMEYNRLLGDFVEYPRYEETDLEVESQHQVKEAEYERPRLGIPTGFINWKEHRADLDRVIWRCIKSGYNSGIPKDINGKLRMHLEHFRNHLDAYDILIKDKVFSKEELYLRSLQEGPAFTEFIKKCRKGSLQNSIAMIDTGVKEDYICPRYNGYDSIFHEAYFPYWDDTESLEDYIYSFIPVNEEAKLIDHLVDDLFETHQVVLEPPDVRWLQPIAGKKTLLDDVEKTTLLKNAWSIQQHTGHYYGKRVIAPTFPGSTRDTAVPDVFTLNALKIIGRAARKAGEQLPQSANCTFEKLNRRINRLRRCSSYLHVDFKKYGLTAPRKVINSILRALELSELQIKDFYLEVDGEVLNTTRGSALGWLDAVTMIGVIAILSNLRKKEKWDDMDFLVFNDDVEIGFKKDHSLEELDARRYRIIEELESFDFILSHRKIFHSKMMIFLENYYEGARIPSNMKKIQLACKMYAKSLSTPFKWKAKAHYADIALRVYNTQLRDICVLSIAERHPIEYSLPVELGGWHYHLDKEKIGDRPLNLALENASVSQISYFLKMRRYKEPHLCPPKQVVNLDLLRRRIDRQVFESYRPDPKQYRERIELDDSENLTDELRDAIQLTREVGRDLPGIIPTPDEGGGIPPDI